MVKTYLDALPDDVILNRNGAVEVQGDSATPLAVESFQNLWSGVATVTPPPEFISYLRSTLCELLEDEEASTLSTQITTGLLGEPLSMNGVKIHIDGKDSLVRLLQELIDTRKSSNDLETAGKQHKLTVQVQISDAEMSLPDQANVHCQMEKLKEQYKNLFAVALRYNDGTFSVKIHTEFNEILFDGEISDAQAMIALAIVLKCYPKAWHQQFFWDAWLAITMQLCVSAGKHIFPCIYGQGTSLMQKG